MQTRQGTFIRARNLEGLGPYGDPERWGGAASIVVPVQPRQGAIQVSTPQLVRAQTSDLQSVSWDCLLNVSSYGPQYDRQQDAVSVIVEFVAGVGQT